ncbi:MAG TPA: amidohydrolase family protein [Chloroflexota bacterium]|jgi:aminocarboxymuconate-semialdehyde decarboxylase
MRIDVHAHYYPTALYEMLERVTGSAPRRMGGGGMVRGFAHHVSLDGQLELMDAAGIECMVMSLGNTPPYYPSQDVAATAARGANDLYVELHARHPRRFRAFIGLPLPHVDAALAELERGLALPGVVGVGLGCSVLGRPLDDPEFDPLFAEFNRRRSAVFVHPIGAGGGPNSEDFSLTWMLASRFEDTIAMARLILSGLTLRYPDIRFIIPHLGGTLALFLQRMDNVAERNGWREQHSQALMPSDLARRFWFDTVNEQHSALRCACETFGVDRLLLGTDWPMLAPEQLKHFVDYVPEALAADDARRILDENAAQLLDLSPS